MKYTWNNLKSSRSMVGVNDNHVTPANKGGLWHNSLISTTAIDDIYCPA